MEMPIDDPVQDYARLQRETRLLIGKPTQYAPVEFVPLSSVKPRKVEWLIPDLIPRGMITILAGKAGEGKTNLALWLAALVSNRGETFNGRPVRHGRVLIWTGEDSSEYVLSPRLNSFGADDNYIDIIGNKTMVYGEVKPFDITTDIPEVEASIQNRNSKEAPYSLLIIDPIVSMVNGDMNQANNVRQALEPLRELAERQNVAVLGITHFSKGSSKSDPQERIIGSQAFSAVARMVLGLAKDEQTGNRRLVILKSNITDTSIGYEFSLEYQKSHDGCCVPRMELLQELHGNARELLAEIEPDAEDGTLLSDAIHFLKGILHDGALSVKQIKAESDGAGYSWATIRRAAEKLKVEKRKEKDVKFGIWLWALPPNQGAQLAQGAQLVSPYRA